MTPLPFAPVKVVIVGDGTSGWRTAASVAAIVGRSAAEFGLLDFEELGIVGGGEATLPHTRAIVRAQRIGESNIKTFGAFGHDIDGVGFHHPLMRGDQIEPISDCLLPTLGARQKIIALDDCRIKLTSAVATNPMHRECLASLRTGI
jgi:tryptophan halogenase